MQHTFLSSIMLLAKCGISLVCRTDEKLRHLEKSTIEILGISLMFILINSWIIPSLDPHNYLTIAQVYNPCRNPFSPTLHLSLFLSLILSPSLPTPYSFPLNIKDVPTTKDHHCINAFNRMWFLFVQIDLQNKAKLARIVVL